VSVFTTLRTSRPKAHAGESVCAHVVNTRVRQRPSRYTSVFTTWMVRIHMLCTEMINRTITILIAAALAGCSRRPSVEQHSGHLAGRWVSDKMEHYSITLEHDGVVLRGSGQTHSDVVHSQFSFRVSGEVVHSAEIGDDVVTLVYTADDHPDWNQTNLFKITQRGGSKTRCLRGIMGTTDVLLDHEERMRHFEGAQQ
jgi:hypothetical protein